MKRTQYRDMTMLKHAKKVVQKYQRIFYKRPLTEAERQEMALWESKVEDEYRKPVHPLTECSGDCDPDKIFDIDCNVHGWAANLSGR